MLTSPRPDTDEIRDNAAFSAVMWAMSRPGSVQDLPEPGFDCVLRALVDRECRAFADNPATEALLRSLGASLVPVSLADHACLSLGDAEGLKRFARTAPGDALYCDTGATVLSRALIGEGPALRLSGPGIQTTCDLRLGGLTPGLWETRARLCRYPQGIEMILVDGARLVALPRSTKVEMF